MSARIQQIYIAMFARPADPIGLQSWNTTTNNGANLTPMINALAGTAEYQARYTGLTNVQAVNAIYQSLFGRDADVAGLTFFVNELASGRQTVATIAVNILDGAQGTDKARIDNKVVAATNFTTAVNTTPEILAYNSSAIPAAQAFLTPITDVATTIPTAAQTDAAIANIVSGSSGATTGQTFTLTTGIDNFVGGGGNDLFQGAATNLGGLDVINGGAGTDTLSLLTAANATLSGSQISGIETLLFNASAATIVTLGAITGVTGVVNNGSTAALTVGDGANSFVAIPTVAINNTASATTIVVQEAAVTGAADAITATLTNVTGAAAVNLDTQTATATVAGAIEILNVVSLGTTANSVTLESNDTQGVGRVNVSGSNAVSLKLGTNVSTDAIIIDGSAATGKMTVTDIGAGNNFAGTAVGHTVTGGSANDSFAFGANYVGAEGAAAARDVVNGGAGTDTVSMQIARVVAASTTAQSNLTSIEGLTISDAWVDASDINVTRFADVTTLTLAAGTAGTSTATVNTGTTVVLGGNSAADSVTSFTVGGTSTTDALTLNMAGFDFVGAGTETFNGIETLNINTGATITDAAVFGNALTLTQSAGVTSSTVVVTGSNAMTFTGVVTGAGTIDASALTGILTVTAVPAAAITIRGGTAADVITGSAGNDLIVGNNGADVITMGAGNDSIDLTETTAAVDKVVFAAVANTDTAAQGLVKTGLNTITGFGATDTLNIAGLGDGTTTATGLTTFTAPAAASAFTDDAVHILNVNGTAGALTTGGTKTVTDFTNLTQVAAFLAERFTLADADQEGVIVWNQTGTTYVYQVSGDATAGFQAADIALVGVVSQTASLAAANLVYA